MVVGVQVGRRAAHELLEARELRLQDGAVGVLVGSVGFRPVRFALKARVEANAEGWSLAYQTGRLLAARHAGHKAGAGDDAPMVSLDDSPVHPGAGAQVVRVHDQVSHLASIAGEDGLEAVEPGVDLRQLLEPPVLPPGGSQGRLREATRVA